MWVEKYRPKTFDEIVDQETAITKLKDFLANGVVPHLILVGPPGTGKTSAAHVFVKSLFPTEMLSECVLELNASEERGIRTVRGKIKRFVSTSIQINNLPVRSIVILDEADALTLDSQYALRRVMEDSSKTSRFILICNYINRIIPPLISRCTILHFYNLRDDSVSAILKGICQAEKVDINLADIKNTDVRQAIHQIQRKATGTGPKAMPPVNWDTILAKNPRDIIRDVDDLILDGFDVDNLIHDFMASRDDFKPHALQVCCNIANHGNPVIQLTSLLLAYR